MAGILLTGHLSSPGHPLFFLSGLGAAQEPESLPTSSLSPWKEAPYAWRMPEAEGQVAVHRPLQGPGTLGMLNSDNIEVLVMH